MDLEVELETLLVGQNESILDVEVVRVVGVDDRELGGFQFCGRGESQLRSRRANRERRRKARTNLSLGPERSEGGDERARPDELD